MLETSMSTHLRMGEAMSGQSFGGTQTSNPVFKRLEKQWSDPSGRSAVQVPGQEPTQPPIYDQKAFEQAREAYERPAAGPVDTGRMTYDDVIIKTSLSLLLLVAVGAASWMLTAANPGLGMTLLLVGTFGGLAVALVNIFSKTVRPALILLYAALEGLMLGALSMLTEAMIPGVVLQAVVATAVVFGVTLALFTSGKVRNSPKMQRFVLISLIGLIGSRLAIWLLSLLGLNMGGPGGYEIMGIPLAVFISVFAVFIGALSLIGDFDQVKVGVESGVPAKYAWMSAFGIMVTVIWLYVEILNILVRMNQRN